MPRRRRLPPALGIITFPHGKGLKRPGLEIISQLGQEGLLAPEDGCSRLSSRPPRPNEPLDCPAPGARRQPGQRGRTTRLYRSSNRRSGSSVAHWCSLVWIFSTRHRPHRASGHGASVFTVDLLTFQSQRCGLAVPLRHVAGFPALGLLRGLRPTSGPSADGGPARRRPGWPGGRAAPRWFPRSPLTVRRGRCPAFPLQPRHEYAAGFPRGLLHRAIHRRRSRPTRRCGRALLPGPYPPDWSRFI